jgi:hypothetical protein
MPIQRCYAWSDFVCLSASSELIRMEFSTFMKYSVIVSVLQSPFGLKMSVRGGGGEGNQLDNFDIIV